MKLNVYCVRDRQTASFGNPMVMQAHGQAIRSFTAEVNRSDKDNSLYLYPDDFELYFMCTFDTDTGLFQGTVPEQIAVGKNVAVRS